MMADSRRQQRPMSLLECLKESIECGVCSEQKELRLLPCQHMICVECLDGIKDKALRSEDVFKCAFCRRELDKTPRDYPICRLAVEFQQQVNQLQSALKRQNNIISKRKSSNRQISIIGCIDEEEELDFLESKGSDKTEEAGEERSNDSEDIHVKNDEPSDTYEEECQAGDCKNKPLQWVCRQCHLFLCNSCRSAPCQTESTIGSHELSHMEDAVEESIKHFQSVKKMLETRIFNARIESLILKGEMRSLAEKLVQCDEEPSMVAEIVQQIRDKTVAIADVESKRQSEAKTMQTFESFINESSDADYVMVAQWIAGEQGAGQSEKKMLFRIVLRRCEQISYESCHGITRCQNNSVMTSGPGTIYFIQRNQCRPEALDCSFDFGSFTGMKYYKKRLYCLRRNPDNGERQISVRDLDYTEICKWKASKCFALGGLTVVADKVYISSKDIADVYTTKGKFIQKIYLQLQSMGDFISYGNNRLIAGDFRGNKIVMVKLDGTRLWSSEVKSPCAICADSNGNIWVWSKAERRIMVISEEGKHQQIVSHHIFSSLKPTDYITSMCIAGPYIWMTSLEKGVIRFEMEIWKL